MKKKLTPEIREKVIKTAVDLSISRIPPFVEAVLSNVLDDNLADTRFNSVIFNEIYDEVFKQIKSKL